MARKKSTSERIKQGTIRPDRIPIKTKKVSIASKYPTPFEPLEHKEEVIYRRLCDHLMDADALHDADTFILTAAAVNLKQMGDIIPELRVNGAIQTFENGTRNVSPEYSVFEKCNSLFLRHSRQLGLDPFSRQNMLIFLEQGDKDDDDPLAGEVPGFSL